MASLSIGRRHRRRSGVPAVITPFAPGGRVVPPKLAPLPAPALEAVADDPHGGAPEQIIRNAYLHWHDPDTVTIHPFKDTPLGDAA